MPGWAEDSSQRRAIFERLSERMAERQNQQRELPNASGTEKITRPGEHRLSLQHGGLERKYLVYVPKSYRAGTPAPLMISMHGGGGSMEYQAAHYGQLEKSEREGFIIVFPNGISPLRSGLLATFNAGTCCGPARDKNIDDVGFLKKMIANIALRLDIDKTRIYSTGMSNGGLMSYRLACELAEVVTAIAPVAGTDNTKSCSPSRPVSVLHIHAANDDHVPFNGGRGVTKQEAAVTAFVSVPDTVRKWTELNQCPATPRRVLEKPGVYCDRYAPCREGTMVQLCVTDSGAHSWPGATKWRSSEPPSKAINANDLMWDFFQEAAQRR
jgi:polyhydroxybutyrate depolymerase